MQTITKQMLKNEFHFDIICGLYYLFGLIFKKRKDFFHKKEYNRFVKKIKSKYEYICKEESIEDNEEIPKKVFVMWFQGLESSPTIVKLCVKSIQKYFEGYEVVIITKNNYEKYIDIPKTVKDCYEKQTISVTHFSDYIRFALLSKWGGYWVDATCLMIDYPMKTSLTFNTLKHGNYSDFHISSGKWATFFMGSSKNNPLVRKGLEILDAHIEKYRYYPCYLFIDVIMKVLYQEDKVVHNLIENVPLSNSNVFTLQKLIKENKLEIFDRNKEDYVYKMNWRYNYSDDEIRDLEKIAKLTEVK